MELCQWRQDEAGCVTFSRVVTSLQPASPMSISEWRLWKVNVKWGSGFLLISWLPAQTSILQ